MRHVLPAYAVVLTLVSTTVLAETHVVEIIGFEFKPQVLVVQAGDTIVWRNQDIVPHTATAEDETWDTGAIAAGEDKQIQVEESFILNYYCRYHPNMLGSIRMGD